MSRIRAGSRFLPILLLLFLAPALMGFVNPLAGKASRGLSYLKQGDYERAASLLSEAAQEEPANAEIQYNLGNAYYGQGKYKEALSSYELVSRSSDTRLQADALYNLGNSQIKLGDYRSAVGSYESALAINPEDQDAKYNLEYARKKIEEQNQKQEQQDQQKQQDQQDRQNQQDQEKQQDQQKQQQDQAAAGQDQQKNQAGQGQQNAQEKQAQAQQGQEQQGQKAQENKQDQGGQQQDQQAAQMQKGQQQDGQENKGAAEPNGPTGVKSDEMLFLTDQEAELLLQSLGRQELDVYREMLRNWAVSRRKPTDKDW